MSLDRHRNENNTSTDNALYTIVLYICTYGDELRSGRTQGKQCYTAPYIRLIYVYGCGDKTQGVLKALQGQRFTFNDGVVATPVKEYAGRIAGAAVDLVSLDVGPYQTIKLARFFGAFGEWI